MRQIISMHSVEEIPKAIMALAPDQARAIERWIHEYYSDPWDRQIEEDALAGRLDAFASEAVAEYKAGKCREL